MIVFISTSLNVYFIGGGGGGYAQNNHLNETVLLSTHNISFGSAVAQWKSA